jgi:group II intron reverse transcriptase/maturase
LYDRIYRPDILWRAWQEVKRNGGSSGVDGISIESIESGEVHQFLSSIAEDLKKGEYRPKPVRRVYIPKTDGRKRPLGIPTVRDRVVQQATKIVLEPIFEANFQPNSYGFRPKRSAHQAVKSVKQNLVRGWQVMDADIEGYYDNIDQELLMQLVKKRVSDRRVLKLIRQWLKAGIEEYGRWKPSDKGTPQGGVISPLLANIYLHVMDMYWKERYSRLGKMIRYADDFVVICNNKRNAEQSYRAINQIMEKLKIFLHPEKTRIIDLREDGFEFLGFHFHKMKSKTSGKIAPYMWPSQKAMKKAKEQIRQKTNRSQLWKLPEEIVTQLNPMIRGWRNYFKVGNSTKRLQTLDRFVRERFWRLHRAKGNNRGRYLRMDKFDQWLQVCGIEYFYKPGRCGSTP